MDNNQMQQLMMQMMMQNNQMMSMLMAQMMPGQMPNTTATPSITFESQGIPNDVSAQIQALKDEIASLKTELAAAKQTGEAYKKSYENLQASTQADIGKLTDLQSIVKKAEAYLGQSIEDIAATAEQLGGDDYYEDKKEEWNKEGISNQEKHERVKKFRDTFIENEADSFWGKEGTGKVIEF